MAEAAGRPYTLIRPITYDQDQEGRALPEAIENALRSLFCEKNGFNMGVNGRGLGRFSFRPKSPQKGWGHLKHDFRLTERLLPDSTMTYRGRSDGLVVESDRKKMITFKFTCHLRDLQGYCVYTSGGFFFFFSRQCVAPITLMDKPPLMTGEVLLCLPCPHAPDLFPSQEKGTHFLILDIRQPISFHLGMDVGEHAYI